MWNSQKFLDYFLKFFGNLFQVEHNLWYNLIINIKGQNYEIW